MLISELIVELEKAKKNYGDVSVLVFDSDTTVAASGCVLETDENDKVTGITVADRETLLAFSDAEKTH